MELGWKRQLTNWRMGGYNQISGWKWFGTLLYTNERAEATNKQTNKHQRLSVAQAGLRLGAIFLP